MNTEDRETVGKVFSGMSRIVKFGKKNFQNYGAQSFFFLSPYVDFFQPFKHVTYSLGAIYLTVTSKVTTPQDAAGCFNTLAQTL